MEQTVTIKIKGWTERQREIIQEIIDTPSSQTKYFVIRASRKAGKSWMLIRGIFYFAIKYPGSELGFISASWRFTQNFFRDLITLIPPQLIKKSRIGETIELKNGSIIDFYTANSDVLPVSRTFDYLFCDEFALYKKDVWTYLRPTVIAKKEAKVIIASTPRGRNSFFDLCQDGINHRGRTKEYRMSYKDNPNIDLQDVEDARLSTSKQLFDQEYNAEFTDGISGVFGDFKNVLSVHKWQEPKHGEEYVYGVDVAGAGEDSTILTIINQQGKVVFIYECESKDLVEQGEELFPLITKYKAKGYVEKTGIGQGLADILKKKGLKVKYWNTTNQNKQELVTQLIININKGEIQLPDAYLCPKLENQMSTFIGKRTPSGLISYSAERDLHDDYVFSLMFANHARKTLSSGLQIHQPDDIMDDFENDENMVHQGYLNMISPIARRKTTWADSLKYD